MKNIRNSIIILLIILSMNISGQITNYINNLNGTVKQIINRESSYSVPITTIKEYDLEGCLKSESVYNGNGFNKDSLKSINKFTYKIDNKNRIFEILIVNQDKEKRKNIIKNEYVIFDVNNSINQSNFSCDVNQKINSIPNEIPNMGLSATPVIRQTKVDSLV